tara:strand:- start:2082 stop:3185 length:1104 start_codon:yes stop_codon:yes gene_type:complete
MCRDNETKRYISKINGQHIERDERGRFAPHAAEEFGAEIASGLHKCDACGKRTETYYDEVWSDMYCREACARGKPDKCRGSCGENGWEVEFNSVNHRGFSNRPSIDSVYGVSIYCKDCGVGFYGDMRNEIYEQEPDRGESKELRAEEFGAEQTLYWSHKRNKECSYCGHGKNHKAALLSDDGKLFGCYKCNSYPNEEEMVADYEAEDFEAQQFYENCSDNQFEIFGRKLYYKCRNVGSVMNQKISGFGDGGLGSYKGGQYALRLAGGMKKYDIMNTLAEVSNDMKPNTMADWRGVVSATNQIISVKNAEEWGAEEFEAFDFLTYCGPCENYTTHYFREEFCDVCNNKYNNEELHSEGLEAQRGLGVK